MGTKITEEQLALLKILGDKRDKAGLIGDMYDDYILWRSPMLCPKCSKEKTEGPEKTESSEKKEFHVICFQGHKIYIGQQYKKPNHGDSFICACENPDCDYIKTAFIDTPATASAEEKGFVRPKVCPITGDVIPNTDRIYNNSQY